jgi:hypothetical protein
MKLKNKKCALAKNKTSLRWLFGLAVSRCLMLFQKFDFMSVNLMVARSLSSIAGNLFIHATKLSKASEYGRLTVLLRYY